MNILVRGFSPRALLREFSRHFAKQMPEFVAKPALEKKSQSALQEQPQPQQLETNQYKPRAGGKRCNQSQKAHNNQNHTDSLSQDVLH